jgi:hypothetical protein
VPAVLRWSEQPTAIANVTRDGATAHIQPMTMTIGNPRGGKNTDERESFCDLVSLTVEIEITSHPRNG